MKNLIISTMVICVSLSVQAVEPRVEENFNLNWQFIRATKLTEHKAPDTKAAWQKVNVPHDYSIESSFVAPGRKHTTPKTIGELGLHMGSRSTGYLPGGPAWYRKTFEVPKEYEGMKVQILFDGVYMYSDVYINGQKLGHHHYGYTAFHYDLTPHLKFGGENEVVVRTDNKLQSRWYPGSGIYRDVKLIITSTVHIPIWGVYVTTPRVTDKEATVAVETKVRNERKATETVTLISRILDLDGKEVTSVESNQDVAADQEVVIKQDACVKDPALWSVEKPNIYRVVTIVRTGGKLVDKKETQFGIRTLKFDPDEGFFLNGVYTRLCGVCMHHDNGLLGAESYSWAEERKIIKLKQMGCNAIRCAHNPPSAAMLDACDRQGILVIDEAFDEWKRGKAMGYANVFDKYWKKDLESMLYRDRNHPCIIMWSTGNEVPDQGFSQGPALSKMLADHIRKIDNTRAVTVAVQPGMAGWGGRFPPPEFFEPVDVCGYNYQNLSASGKGNFKKNHEEFPGRIMYQSESMNMKFFGDWMNITSTKYILGDFVWTGVDYLGEVGCGSNQPEGGNFPAYTTLCGDLDICCFRKPRSYYRQLLWHREPTVYITVLKPMPPPKGRKNKGGGIHNFGALPSQEAWICVDQNNKVKSVDVYSGCQEAELFLNGKSLGRKPTSQTTRFMARWSVPFEEGQIKAVGYVDNKAVSEHVIIGVGKPDSVKLTVDRQAISSDGCDLCYVTAEIVDEKGIRYPLSADEITFELSGPASIAGVGSSNSRAPADPFHGNKCRAYKGRALLILRSGTETGTVEVKANVEGLKSGSVDFKVQ